jgi:protein TonB
MFETTVVRPRAIAAPRRYALLSASVGFHTVAVCAIIFAALRSVDFPVRAPNQFELLRAVAPVLIPPALGTPHAAPRPATPRTSAPPAAPTQPVAPRIIPDAVPTIPANSDASAGPPSTASGPPNGEGEGEGSPNGTPDGIGSGETTVGVPASAGPYWPTGDVKSPVTIHRVEPVYPRLLVAARKSGTVRVRCIIDRSGKVRNPEVIQSSFGAFDQPALDAVSQWRFTPGMLHGQPVETWFELTVKFEVR